MAKKRLNKKVVIIGLVALVCLVGTAAYVGRGRLERFFKSPEDFIAEAETQLEQVESLLEEYRGAVRSGTATEEMLEAGQESFGEYILKHGKAYVDSKDDAQKIEILFKMAECYLIANEFHEPEWEKAMGSWKKVANIDPSNIKSRMLSMQYYYDVGDSGIGGQWPRVKELIEGVGEDDPDALIHLVDAQTPEYPFVLKAKGRANFAMAFRRQTTDPMQTVGEALKDFDVLLKLTPEDAEVYKFYSEALLLQGSLRNPNTLDPDNESVKAAEEILQQGVDALGDDPAAHVNLLRYRMTRAGQDEEKLQTVGKDMDALVSKFPSSGEAWICVCDYYKAANELDRAIEAAERAMELDKQNVDYAMSALDLYYFKSSLDNDSDAFDRAIETAVATLERPDAMDIPGPKQFRRKHNRRRTLEFLCRLYIEKALEAAEAGDVQLQKQWAEKTSEPVFEIEQLYGSAENINCMMWRAIVTLARGDTQPAIKQMYDIYRELKGADRNEQVLSYALAWAFRDRPEVGSRIEFLYSAITSGAAASHPDLILDYAELILQMKDWTNALGWANIYETNFAPTQRSRSIKVSAYTGAGEFDSSMDLLKDMDDNSPETKHLRLELLERQIAKLQFVQTQQALTATQQQELDNYQSERLDTLNSLTASDSKGVSVRTLTDLWFKYVTDNNNTEARQLVEKFLSHSPDDTTAQILKLRLSEPDALNIPAERYSELMLEVLSGNPDKFQAFLSRGSYLLGLSRYEEATAEFEKALEISPEDKDAAELLFQAAVAAEPDSALAKALADKAVQDNLDGCKGNFYLAKLDFANSNAAEALSKIDQVLEARPVFSRGYLLRSRIHAAFGDDENAIADAETAVTMNPLDITILKQKISVLHDRNTRLGTSATAQHRLETENALRRAIGISPTDWRLKSLFAEYRAKNYPEEALALRQSLQRSYPNLTNHLLLGNMAVDIARTEGDLAKRQLLLDIAGSAYEKGYALEPNNKRLLEGYSNYLRITGQQDKAAALFASQEDVLWQFYLRDGQYDKASEILTRLYEADPKQADVVRGLAAIAQATTDKEGLKKYTEELIAIDTDAETIKNNQLLQMQMYLEVGLVKEAELKLASFRERYSTEEEPLGELLGAWVARLKGQLPEALELANRYLEIDSENAGAWRLRGQIHRLRSDYIQAVEDLQKSKNLAPGAMISMDLAQAYRQTGNLSAAIGELTTALQDEMAPVRVRLMLEQFYREANRNSDLERFYQNSIAKFPDSEQWYYRFSLFYLRERDFPKAEQLITEAWRISSEKEAPSEAVLDLYLEVLWYGGKYDEVLSTASKYVDGPLASVALAQMAQTYAKTDKIEDAFDYYKQSLLKCGNDNVMILAILRNMERAVGLAALEKWAQKELESRPDSFAPNVVMYNLANSKADYNKAIEHIDKCMSVISKSDEYYYRYAIIKANTLVSAYGKTGDEEYLGRAIEEYEAILENQTSYLNVLNNLAYILADSNRDVEKAEEYGAQAYASAPNNPNVIDTYAYTLCKTGQYSKAEELLRTAIQLHELSATPIPWEVYKHLGMAQEGLNQKDNAAESYKNAIDIGGDNIDAETKDELNKLIEVLSQQ